MLPYLPWPTVPLATIVRVVFGGLAVLGAMGAAVAAPAPWHALWIPGAIVGIGLLLPVFAPDLRPRQES